MYNYGFSFEAISFGSTIRCWRCYEIQFWIVKLFLEANHIVMVENLHASASSDIATSRELLQLITSSCSSILRLESAGLAGARRVDPLEVIKSPTSLTKQERRRAIRRKRSVNILHVVVPLG